MAYGLHDPAALGHANGFSLSNGANTDAAAGWVLTCALSSGGSITFQDGRWLVQGEGVARFDGAITAAPAVTHEVLWQVLALPTPTNVNIHRFRNTANGNGPSADLLASGAVEVRHAGGSVLGTSPALGLGVGDFFRTRLSCERGTTTSDGKIRFDVYTADNGLSTTPAWSLTPSDAVNTGITDYNLLRFGDMTTTVGSTSGLYIVDAQYQDSLAAIGPYIREEPVTSQLALQVAGTPADLHLFVNDAGTLRSLDLA